MKTNYDFCVKEVLKSEGGYTNDPQDRGGPTNFGITIHDYRAYINKSGTAKDVRRMTVDQAKAIYKSKYWDAVNGDLLPSGVDYTVFDYGVNSGVGRALKVSNRLTAEQYAGHHDLIWLINAINNERMAFLHSLRTWPHFGRGWQTRVASVRANSIKLAKEGAPWAVTPTPSSTQQPKPSLPTSSHRSPYKVLQDLWSKIFSTGTSKGSAPTP